jgi:hypothetical protein
MQGGRSDLSVVHLADCCKGEGEIQNRAVKGNEHKARVRVDVSEQRCANVPV